jgi:hypothetical protein
MVFPPKIFKFARVWLLIHTWRPNWMRTFSGDPPATPLLSEGATEAD